jgi:electron transfer flavoprotein alpha subunit
LVKQIPAMDEMRLGPEGRLVRDGAVLEMSAYCRRAVSKSVDLASKAPGSSVVVMTLGPPDAEDVLREAIAWGLSRGVDTRGVLLTDSAFRGSDTIATARALSALLRREGPFDLVLTGRNSLDADTGQVPPQIAEFLDLPFATGVKELVLAGEVLTLGCEHDDSWADLEIELPALLSCAERLCEPSKMGLDKCAQVPEERVSIVTALDLGPGPWGDAGSLTEVGDCREIVIERSHKRSVHEPLADQVRNAVQFLLERGALSEQPEDDARVVPVTGGAGGVVAVIAEPGNEILTREMCGLAARLASRVSGSTVLLAPQEVAAAQAGSWGADRVVRIVGAAVEEDVARAVTVWAHASPPWAILAGSTAYGREVASRVAVALRAGLTGDAVEANVVDGALVAWKPAFGGQLVAAITARSATQMVTVRAGVIPLETPRAFVAEVEQLTVQARGRVRLIGRRRADSLEGLGKAEVVIGIGNGVDADSLPLLEDILALLGAELGCTRKLTDAGWMPHSRQIGITGRSLAPRLYIAIGTSGKFNHMAGVRAAGSVLAINSDPDALIWKFSDVGVVGRWQDSVPLLAAALREALQPS